MAKLRLTQKPEEIKAQHALATRRHRNKRIITGVLVAGVVFVFVALFFSHFSGTTKGYDSFAKCVTASGATMYGTEWCSNCQAQKRLFGMSFRYIAYQNCDANPTLCDEQKIKGYPTWILKDGTPLVGYQELNLLAERTGCTLS